MPPALSIGMSNASDVGETTTVQHMVTKLDPNLAINKSDTQHRSAGTLLTTEKDMFLRKHLWSMMILNTSPTDQEWLFNAQVSNMQYIFENLKPTYMYCVLVGVHVQVYFLVWNTHKTTYVHIDHADILHRARKQGNSQVLPTYRPLLNRISVLVGN